MPIYEYECNECRCRFEKRQRFYDEATATCPKCQGKSKRVLSPVPTIFKGSGFYVTDSRKNTDTTTGSSKDKSTSDK
jgi:putative FmdB family regulatory protein